MIRVLRRMAKPDEAILVRNTRGLFFPAMSIAIGICLASPEFFTAGVFAQDEQPALTCAQLQKEYESLKADRDNLLTQAKKYMEYKATYQELESLNKQYIKERDAAQKDLQARNDQVMILQQKLEDLESANTFLEQEKDNLKNSLEKAAIEYKIVPETRKEITRLQKENSELLRTAKQVDQKIQRAEEEKLDVNAKAELYRRQLNDFRKSYEQALAKNRLLEKKASAVPAKFAEMARENKILKKETGLMHYNLGVFYAQAKEYSRAIAEFEKAIDINPDDAYAHYNLGYIYAEHLADRPKAMEEFRQFLRLVKTEDKDVDWVKKYILTWQTWDGKKTMQ